MAAQARAAVVDLVPRLLPDAFPNVSSEPITGAPDLDTRQRGEVVAAVGAEDFTAFSDALTRVGNCARPVRIVGSSLRVDTVTGEVLSSYSSRSEPLGVTHVRCGNRRASVCPSCARLYGQDTYWLIRAGIAGGKTVPERVADNPLVFVTLTAPSFGPVHGIRDGGACRPRRDAATCPHGLPLSCPKRHCEDDPLLGQPLCPRCYDYSSHLIWQWWAPQLWQRFNIALKRAVARQLGVAGSRLCDHATVQYAKVCELQRRGAVHFHALVRLDGPRTSAGFAPAPGCIDVEDLGGLVERAAASVRLEVPGPAPDDVRRILCFGRQVDVRTVNGRRREDEPGRALTAGQVASYVAKYATKSIADDIDDNPHFARIRATAHAIARRTDQALDHWTQRGLAPPPYARMARWAHELGYHGHFSSKSRRYSITLGQIRRARRRARVLEVEARARGEVIDLAEREAELLAAEDAELSTSIVIGQWAYSGSGWVTEGQTLLARAAAAAGREYAREEAAARRNQKDDSPKGRIHGRQ